MKEKQIRTMVLIGAGKLGTTLGPAFARAGVSVLQVVDRNRSAGALLAKRLGVEFVSSPVDVRTDADLYLLAVTDGAIGEVAHLLPPVNGMVAHTSGATPMTVLRHSRIGVIWPVFTFSGKRVRSWRKIPFLIEGNTAGDQLRLQEFAGRLSNCVVTAGSEERLKIHLAAVFASNFSNYMAAVAVGLLKQAGSEPDLIAEILRTTSRNMLDREPFRYQTGPALRGDTSVMEAHLRLLEHDPELQAIYRQISAGIQNMKKKHG